MDRTQGVRNHQNISRRCEMEHSYTGRREDRRLVTGAGMFTADWDRPDALHAAFLRTDRAHARIVSSDVAAAQAAPGVRVVLTGADMQAAGHTRGVPLMPLGRGEALKVIVAPALALGCVRYVGEPVALVVADSPHAAQDACELIRIDYQFAAGGRERPRRTGTRRPAAACGCSWQSLLRNRLRRQCHDASRLRRRQARGPARAGEWPRRWQPDGAKGGHGRVGRQHP